MDASLLNMQLARAFEKSALVQNKIPDESKRKLFLEKLLGLPEYKKEIVLVLLKKGDQVLDEQAAHIIQQLMKTKNEMKSISKEAKNLVSSIEIEDQNQGAEDILKQL